MNRWLATEEFVPHASAAIGAQTRVNHAKCAAGRDTKRRLYVKRVERGIVAYCHHCGLKGAAFKRGGEDVWNGMTAMRNNLDNIQVASELKRYERAVRWIEYYESAHEPLPEYAHEWVYHKKGIDNWVTAGVRWGAPADEEPGLILPIHGPDGRVVGVQVRRVFTKIRGDKRQKYETFLAEKTRPAIYGPKNSLVVVLCEDYLSAMRLRNAICAVPLYGNSVSGEMLGRLSLTFEHLVVWMDNDKPEITEAATKIAVQAEPLFDRVTCILDAHEPTKYTDAQLAEICGSGRLSRECVR